MPTNRSNKIVVVLCLTALWLLLLACTPSDTSPFQPTREEMAEHGFYVYVVPKRDIESSGWLEVIEIWSWDRHCLHPEFGSRYNPITVTYRGDDQAMNPRIVLDPWDANETSMRPLAEIVLDTPIASDLKAEIFSAGSNSSAITMRFVDQFGVPIYIEAELSIHELELFVESLEYVGPPEDEVINPWECNNGLTPQLQKE